MCDTPFRNSVFCRWGSMHADESLLKYYVLAYTPMYGALRTYLFVSS